MPHAVGSPVRVEMTKWGDRPHWQMPAVFLGSDAFGEWLGFPVQTHMTRPGASFISSNLQVGLVPDAAWLATFHGPGGLVRTYVDMTTVPVWDGATLRAVDLDLDVVERLDGTVFVDDEDEFAEHQVSLGYPDSVIALASASRDAVFPLVRDRIAPFDGATGERWLAVLAAALA